MNGRTLAIDFGERRIGLALSDEMGIIASGIGTIPNDDQTLPALAAMAKERGVQRIIVGLPLTLSGERGSSVTMVETFVAALRSLLPLPVTLVDERFTSSLAEQAIRDMGVGRKKRREKGKVDEIAAVILLQGYLDSQ
ncbi:MAG: Holliday junction resolvase RuvX [Bacteroidia bacterium]|nr:Holliday junction resolvase RuvX [Bacteroidia bacterium]